MNINQLLVIGILLIEFIIYLYLFSHKNIKKAVGNALNESRDYKDISNFIEIKKYEFNNIEKSLSLLLGFLLIIILTMKITGLLTLLGFIFIAIIFIPEIQIYRKLTQVHSKIIRKLYLEKDRKF